MRPITLAGSWLQIVATLVLFLAVVLRSGGPVSAFKSNDVSVPEAISLIESGALVIDVRYSPGPTCPAAFLFRWECLGGASGNSESARRRRMSAYGANGIRPGPEARRFLPAPGSRT